MWRRTWQATKSCLHKKVFFAKHKKMNSSQKTFFQQKKIGLFPPAIIYFLFRQKTVFVELMCLSVEAKVPQQNCHVSIYFLKTRKKNMENKLTRQRTVTLFEGNHKFV
jgi:hypothetical protein